MRKITFWEALLGDVGHYERRAINEAAEQINLLRASRESQAYAAHKQLRRLYALDKAQSKELAQLRTIVKVLASVLVEQGLIDGAELKLRVESALDELEQEARAQESATLAGDPYRGAFPVTYSPAARTDKEPSTVCSRCGDRVLLRRTEITDEGNVCDDCFYQVVRRE